MKVKITKSISGVRYVFAEGDIVEIDDKIGQELIRIGVAITVEETEKKKKKGE